MLLRRSFPLPSTAHHTCTTTPSACLCWAGHGDRWLSQHTFPQVIWKHLFCTPPVLRTLQILNVNHRNYCFDDDESWCSPRTLERSVSEWKTWRIVHTHKDIRGQQEASQLTLCGSCKYFMCLLPSIFLLHLKLSIPSALSTWLLNLLLTTLFVNEPLLASFLNLSLAKLYSALQDMFRHFSYTHSEGRKSCCEVRWTPKTAG